MIPIDKIKAVISALATNLGIIIIRADQSGTHPPYPFGVYKVISSNEDSAHQDIIEVVEGSGSTYADIKRYEKSQAIVSLNFLDKDRIDRIITYATNALRYFKSYTGRQAAEAQEITVLILSPSIEDRTIYQEAFFENKIGFDLRFDYTGLDTEEDVEAIGTLTIETERDGVSGDDLDITIT